jgi:very-short-patch-repair endonuclease
MHRIFNQSYVKAKRKDLRLNMTASEQRLWRYLRGKRMAGHKFRRQFSVDQFIVDFYSPELKLAIEIDGDSHAGEKEGKYDKLREKHFSRLGVNFLRFTNQEVMKNLESVLMAIASGVAKKTPPNLPLAGEE